MQSPNPKVDRVVGPQAQVRVIEVGPRDGLQSEPGFVPTAAKAEWILGLQHAGIQSIEVTSFVAVERVPQLADAEELVAALPPNPLLSGFAPNRRGLARLVHSGLRQANALTAASAQFLKRNINRSSEEVWAELCAMALQIKAQVPSVRFRVYLSTAFECPYEGRRDPGPVAELVCKLLESVADEVAISDTVGAAVPNEVAALCRLLEGRDTARVAWHFHDTRGTALANVAKALEFGYSAFDASSGGLGGCPYAPGAGGNLATEDLVYFLERSGLTTGIDLDGVIRATEPVLQVLRKETRSKVWMARGLAPAKPK